MDYRIGNRKDLTGILELYKQLGNSNGSSFSVNEANKIWDDNIENNNIKYFIAEEEDKILGSLYICILPNLSNNGKSIGFIENVIIDEKYRNKGIGKKLMEMAIEYANENSPLKLPQATPVPRK